MTSATCRNVYFSSIHAHSCVGHHEVRAMDPEPVPTYFECFKAIYFAAIKFFTAEGQQLSLQHFHKAFVEYCSISQNDVLVILGLAVFLTLLRFLLSKLVFTVSVNCSNTLESVNVRINRVYVCLVFPSYSHNDDSRQWPGGSLNHYHKYLLTMLSFHNQ